MHKLHDFREIKHIIFGTPLVLKESIFFPLKVVHTRIENNLKGHQNEKSPKLNFANTSVF